MHSRILRFFSCVPGSALLVLMLPGTAHAQHTRASDAAKPLSVQRIFSQPDLSGRSVRGIAWTPDGQQVSFLEEKNSSVETATVTLETQHQPKATPKKAASTDLWIMDATSGERRLLVSADRLQSMLPANSSEPTQATGLGRHPPADYQWAPDGAALLFQGPTALVWFDLKTETSRTLVSGKPNVDRSKNLTGWQVRQLRSRPQSLAGEYF